ncbi:MAG: hypothetical protein WC003_14140 [Terrimicrobiaceae bacterium]
MKIINERNTVLERLAAAGETGVPILCPNAETPEEMAGILLGAQRHAVSAGLPVTVIGIGVTASYPDHPQLGRLAMLDGSDSLETAAKIWMHWLRGYEECGGLFGKVEAIPFLDHGWVPLEADRSLMDAAWFQEAMGIKFPPTSLCPSPWHAAARSMFRDAKSLRTRPSPCWICSPQDENAVRAERHSPPSSFTCSPASYFVGR